ncbi:hypothetical protein BJV78DRAFT_1251554, partial [Lactifluus subvellereus]
MCRRQVEPTVNDSDVAVKEAKKHHDSVALEPPVIYQASKTLPELGAQDLFVVYRRAFMGPCG